MRSSTIDPGGQGSDIVPYCTVRGHISHEPTEKETVSPATSGSDEGYTLLPLHWNFTVTRVGSG